MCNNKSNLEDLPPPLVVSLVVLIATVVVAGVVTDFDVTPFVSVVGSAPLVCGCAVVLLRVVTSTVVVTTIKLI